MRDNHDSSIAQRLLVLIWILAGTGPAVSQGGVWEEIWHEQGTLSYDGYGWFLGALGDMDGDRVPDFSVSTYSMGLQHEKVFLYSGSSGQLHLMLEGTLVRERFGSSLLPVPDRDGDGQRDLLIGSPGWFSGSSTAGRIGLHSWRTGYLLQFLDGQAYGAVAFGEGLIRTGDLDLDGMDDFLVDDSTSLLAISRRNGDLLWQRSRWYGWSSPDAPFATLGADLDQDGVDEVVIGDPWWPTVHGFTPGLVRVLSGKDGTLLWNSAPGTAGQLGQNLAVVGDLDGDTIPDILAGEPGDNPYGTPGPARALLLSGADGAVIRAHDSTSNGEWMGQEVASLGESWDSDDVPDYVVATPWYSNPNLAYDHEGKVDVYSGASGRLLVTFYGDQPGAKFGWRCTSIGDLTGDGFPELLISAFLEDHPNGTPDVGGVHMFTFHPLLTVAPPTLSLAAGTPSAAEIDFPIQEANWPYAVLASATGVGPTLIGGVEVPLSSDPLFARMAGGWMPPLLQHGRGVLDAQGDATARIYPSPALAAHLGRTFWIAAVSWDPAYGTLRLSSIARPLTIVP